MVCPAAVFRGKVNFSSCGQSKSSLKGGSDGMLVIECKRRPELGNFEPTIKYSQCPIWLDTGNGFIMKEE